MSATTRTIERFVQAGVAAQAAVDRAIERAELVRLVRDRGARVRELAGAIGYGVDRAELDEAIEVHARAVFALDEFDHAGRAVR